MFWIFFSFVRVLIIFNYCNSVFFVQNHATGTCCYVFFLLFKYSVDGLMYVTDLTKMTR